MHVCPQWDLRFRVFNRLQRVQKRKRDAEAKQAAAQDKARRAAEGKERRRESGRTAGSQGTPLHDEDGLDGFAQNGRARRAAGEAAIRRAAGQKRQVPDSPEVHTPSRASTRTKWL